MQRNFMKDDFKNIIKSYSFNSMEKYETIKLSTITVSIYYY